MEKSHESLIPGEILENRPLGAGYFELVFQLSGKYTVPEPGQFLTIKCGTDQEPLLRRPFAYASCSGRTASIIVETRGPGTRWLSRLKTGSRIDILGPLGKGFLFPEKGPIYLAAGGIGLGPMLYTRSVLKASGREVLLVTGFRDANRVIKAIPPEKDVVICTDDGSHGFKGTVTDFLETVFEPGGTLLACGPHPMLKSCRNLALSKKGFCQVSVEEVMACGIGACAGCVLPGKAEKTFFRACKDGPVFDSEVLAWT